VSISAHAQAQEPWALGIGGIYNFQTDGIGADIRAYIPLTYRLTVSPQFFIFPTNIVHEFYAGVSLQYTVLFIRNWQLYALGAGYYNNWYNYSSFDSKIAKPNNFSGEVGAGFMRSHGCLKPFIEGRYDTKWMEARLHIGILISFNDCFSPRHLCAAYQ
jgi:hypothetical protein